MFGLVLPTGILSSVHCREDLLIDIPTQPMRWVAHTNYLCDTKGSFSSKFSLKTKYNIDHKGEKNHCLKAETHQILSISKVFFKKKKKSLASYILVFVDQKTEISNLALILKIFLKPQHSFMEAWKYNEKTVPAATYAGKKKKVAKQLAVVIGWLN